VSFHVPGVGLCATAEEDAAGATTPAAALDRILRLTHRSFLAINLLEPREYDNQGRPVMNHPDHLHRVRAMRQLVALIGDVIANRRALQHRQEADTASVEWVVPDVPTVAATAVRPQPATPARDTPGTDRRDAA
jgi:hypothetical protein